MYIISGIIVALVILNYFLSLKLYDTPKNEKYFENVKDVNFSRERVIAPEPKYVAVISGFVGIMLGIYIALWQHFGINKWVAFVIILIMFCCYLIEITRKIMIREGKLVLEKVFSRSIILSGREIKGMYIYSFNKRFLKKHALTTKLVITATNGKTYKFVLSSLKNKAVLNMMKENFGIADYKMYISKKAEATNEIL